MVTSIGNPLSILNGGTKHLEVVNVEKQKMRSLSTHLLSGWLAIWSLKTTSLLRLLCCFNFEIWVFVFVIAHFQLIVHPLPDQSSVFIAQAMKDHPDKCKGKL